MLKIFQARIKPRTFGFQYIQQPYVDKYLKLALHLGFASGAHINAYYGFKCIQKSHKKALLVFPEFSLKTLGIQTTTTQKMILEFTIPTCL